MTTFKENNSRNLVGEEDYNSRTPWKNGEQHKYNKHNL